MRRKAKAPADFKDILKKYFTLKTVEILLYLKDGKKVALGTNRELLDEIIIVKGPQTDIEIPISSVLYAELYAA